MKSGPLVLRMYRGVRRTANNPIIVLMTSSLVMLRSTCRARHFRVYLSAIEIHVSGLPLVVRSKMKSHAYT